MPSSEYSLGPYLRSIREERGIDVKDVVASTKIQPKFIEALESENYNQLPKGPFVIGFLRSYAQCLSLDADEVIAFFQSSQGRRPSRPPAVARRPAAAEPAPSWRRPAILGVACIALLAIGFFALRGGPAIEPTAPAAPSATVATELPADRQADAALAVALPAAPEASAPETTAPAPPPPVAAPVETPPATAPSQVETAAPETPAPVTPAPLILRVEALEETWLRLEIDEDNRLETLIKAGQSAEWKANSQFSLTLGNVQGARVALNDQKLELPKTRSNVLRDYVLTRALLTPRRTD